MSTLERLKEPPCDMEYIRQRCREIGGCWVWAGAMKEERWPVFCFRRVGVDGEKRNFNLYVRHVAYWLKTKKRPVFVGGKTLRTSCKDPHCVNPAHMVMETFADVQKDLRHQSKLANRIKVATARRQKSKLSDAAVLAIRESELPRKELAALHGVSREYVRLLQIGAWRRDYTNNPFGGLMA
jgi:hypothetical protein